MDSPTKRLWALWLCTLGVLILLAREFIVGFLSPHGLLIAVFIVGLATAAVMMFIVTKSAKEFNVPTLVPGTSIDAVTRNRLLRRIRMAKTTIVIMGVTLVVGLIEFKNGPVLPLLVGVVINLLTTAKSVQTVVRLKKLLN
jgi:hypothetical protein